MPKGLKTLPIKNLINNSTLLNERQKSQRDNDNNRQTLDSKIPKRSSNQKSTKLEETKLS
jgi:hypothetical protein